MLMKGTPLSGWIPHRTGHRCDTLRSRAFPAHSAESTPPRRAHASIPNAADRKRCTDACQAKGRVQAGIGDVQSEATETGMRVRPRSVSPTPESAAHRATPLTLPHLPRLPWRTCPAVMRDRPAGRSRGPARPGGAARRAGCRRAIDRRRGPAGRPLRPTPGLTAYPRCSFLDAVRRGPGIPRDCSQAGRRRFAPGGGRRGYRAPVSAGPSK
jgi:hypothetical protein